MWSFSPEKVAVKSPRPHQSSAPKRREDFEWVPDSAETKPSMDTEKNSADNTEGKSQRGKPKGKGKGDRPRNDKYKNDRPKRTYTYVRKEEAENPQALPPGITEQPVQRMDETDPDDEAFQHFIAGTINVAGVKSNRKAAIGDLAPIEPAMIQSKQQAGEIDRQFWKDLDALDSILKAKGKIDEGSCTCKICAKTCKSTVKLLQHCWELHKDLLAD